MRFSVVTVGSEGDTRPVAALCRGLLDRGHEVKLFADGSTLTMPRSVGVPCEALQGDIRSIVPSAVAPEKLRFSKVIVGKALEAYIASNSAAWLRAVGEHAQRSDAILFCSLALSIGLTLGDELRKTIVGLSLQPGAPTREFCSPGLPPMKLPGWLNLWTHRLKHRELWGLFAESAPEARREVFGTRVAGRPRYDFPVLYGISKELVAQPADWPADHIICGHWSSPMSAWQPPPELREFIGDQPPIFAGFGSSSDFVRTEALQALIAAVAGRRTVFSAAWSAVDRSKLPDNFFIARYVPFEWLFPRVSLVIHHGGGGTTQIAARAGVPQIILPFGGDQPFWAERVTRLGVALTASNKMAVNAAKLARMIEFARLDATRLKAQDLGRAMAREDGVGRAVREIEMLVELGRKQ